MKWNKFAFTRDSTVHKLGTFSEYQNSHTHSQAVIWINFTARRASFHASKTKLERTLKILNWSKILTSVCWKMATFAPEYVQGNAKVNVSKWSHQNSPHQKKQTNKKNEEINFSSKNSFLHSHHQTLGRRSLHITHWLESEKNMQTWQVYFGEYYSKLSVMCWATKIFPGIKFHRCLSDYSDNWTAKKIMRMRGWMCVLCLLLAIITGKNLPLCACLQDS